MTAEETDGRVTVPDEGDVFTYERRFTTEEVREFSELTGDRQSIHTDPDEDGRLVAQGLLSGSLMTKIGGDLEYIARTMTYEFLKPVYTGETITCEWTVESKTETADRYRLENDVVYRNESGTPVIEASTTGLIWKQDWP